MIFEGVKRRQGTLAEQFVQDRRREESKVNNLNSYLKTDMIARHVASWEDKGSQMNRDRFTKQRIGQLRKQFEEQSNMRRRKLKNLYDHEERMYEQEIRKMRPTKEQIKQDMIEKVQALKSQRESQRQLEVQERLDRRFKQGADELRKIESDVKEFQTQHERDIQMIEKQRKMEREYAEEMIYAELWRRDADNKFRTEREKKREAFLKNQARNQILDNQYSTLMRKKRQEEEEQKREKGMLRKQWQEEAQRARDELENEKLMHKTLNNQIFKENLIRKKMKEHDLLRERQADKQMINDLVEMERQAAMLEAEEKERHKQETINYLKNFKSRANELKLNQDHLDKLLEEERQKQWKKRQDQWDKEERARINLMYDVYNDRAGAVEYKKRLLEEENRKKRMEKMAVTQEIDHHLQDVKRKELEEMLKMRQHQNTVLWQVNEKREKSRKEILEEMEQERERRLKELQYQMRIDQERERGRRLLEETRRNRPY